jgi:hypothetical protein
VPRRKSAGTINNLVVVSDTHFGCRLSLCPPQGAALDDGGRYLPSKFQLTLWAWWREFWDEWVPQVTHGEPYAVLHNGDVIDGKHHDSCTQISQNIQDQAALAVACLKPIVELCEGRYYQVRGTEAHVGPSAQYEEQVAKELGAIPNDVGQHARWELWKMVGNGLVHASHHIGTTGSNHYESTAVHKELVEAFTEAGRWDQRPPDVIVRSHRHREIKTEIPTKRGRAIAQVTPGWQGKTPFAYRIAGGRQSLPQFGGVIVRMGGEELHTRPWVKSAERGRVE